MKRRKKRREIRVPSRLMIGDQEYRVIVTPDLSDKISGLCFTQEKVIAVNSSLPRRELWATLFHEICHAWDEELGTNLGHPRIEKLEYALLDLISQIMGGRS